MSAMEKYNIEQRIFFIKSYYTNACSATEVVRKARTKYGIHLSLNKSTVSRLVEKFEATGSVDDRQLPGGPVTVRTEETIAAVRDSVAKKPTASVRRRAQELGISYGSLRTILNKDLRYHPYKVSINQQLKIADPKSRYEFAGAMMSLKQTNDDFFDKIIFSDEAHFHLDGYVNRQNYRIWGSENPHVIVEKPLHPLKVTVWCAFWSGGVIGPFFENDAGQAETVNGTRYRAMLTDFFWEQLDSLGRGDLWFQQDGATCHTAAETIKILKTRFPGRLISKKGDIDWPARSPDLSPLDFFLWGFLKDRVYASAPKTIQDLKERITENIAAVNEGICENVIQNYAKRLTYCLHVAGGHSPDIVFHT